ncbi:MAG: LysR substrate-binding domain-containing protein [Pseudomonadota bacterium]
MTSEQIANIGNIIDFSDGVLMLKVSQMRAFNEVMLTGSISEAARNLHRTQSSVSATIASIEADLGMALFERRSGRLHPVPEARYLQDECESILRRLERLSGNMHRVKSLQTGELHIASMPGPSLFFLPKLITENADEHPDIRTEIVSRSSEGVYRLVAAQRYDLGIADHIPDLSEETALIETQVFDFPCLCAVPLEHRLASAERLTPDDIGDLPLATLGEEHAIHGQILQAFAQVGRVPNIRHTTQYFLSLLSFVEDGLAMAVVDSISVVSYADCRVGKGRLVFRPLWPKVSFRVALLTPRHRPQSLIGQRFVGRVQDALSALETA